MIFIPEILFSFAKEQVFVRVINVIFYQLKLQHVTAIEN